MKSRLQHITYISLSHLINKLAIMWQLAGNKHYAHLSAWSIADHSTCVLRWLLGTGHALLLSPNTVASFVHYSTYPTLQRTTKCGLSIGWLQQCTDCRLNISQTINRLHWQIVKSPIWCKTCNPAGGRFRQIVEIGRFPDTGSDIHPPDQTTRNFDGGRIKNQWTKTALTTAAAAAGDDDGN